VTPFTISVSRTGADFGRVVGFKGDGYHIIGMHGLQSGVAARSAGVATSYRSSRVNTKRGFALVQASSL
jgi:hypothetical protein